MIANTYILRNGAPCISTVTTNARGVVTVVSNKKTETDVVITKQEYEAALEAIKSTKIQSKIDATEDRKQRHADKQIKKSAAKSKLLTLGLTEDEVDAIFE